jgi:hypothetical protein
MQDAPDGAPDPDPDPDPASAPPRRVRVTSPRVRAAPRPPLRPPTRDIDEQTGVGEVYMRSLMRVQLRRGLRVLGAVVLGLVAVPLVFAVAPGAAQLRPLGVPLPWLLLGVVVHPLVAAAGWWHVRLAERTESEFTDLLAER